MTLVGTAKIEKKKRFADVIMHFYLLHQSALFSRLILYKLPG